MLEAMKPFVNTFMESQGLDTIQWAARPGDLSEGENDGEEEANVKRNDKSEVADDEVLEGDEMTSHVKGMEDVFTPAQDVDLGEQSTPIHQLRTKKTSPKGRNILRIDETNLDDGTSNS
ncbi:hypothetical protein GOBAR_DD19750 [Gossypium barbadense]|nr:hypothetical protein GOBAR_DD19750 [Gossypium barbadense]